MKLMMLIGVVGLACGPGGALAWQPELPAPAAEEVAPAPALFITDPDAPPPGLVPNEMIPVRAIVLDVAQLRRLRPGHIINLDPEGDGGELWVVESISTEQELTKFVRLRHGTDPTGYAAFATVDDATAMTLHLPSRKQTYRLQFGGGGDRYHVWRVNRGAVDPEGLPLGVGIEPPRITPPDEIPPITEFGERDGGGCNGGNRVLDIMIVYTTNARDEIGGTTAIRAESALAVDHFNTAAAGSALPTRMRLVYCNVVTYTESGDHDFDLPRLRDTNDGFMDDVHTTRNSVNADIVELVLSYGSGLGYCPGGAPTYAGSPFNTVAWNRMAVTFTTAHECGHNLGGGHDAAVQPPCGPAYGAGWRFFGNDDNGYCTTLAYPTDVYERILRYSNPNVNFQGVPTGNAAVGHNARVIADNDGTVEGFEATRYDIYVDFDHIGLEFGLAALPYNTMTEGINNIDAPNTGAGELPTMYITSGSQTYHGTISDPMNLVACGGSVTLN